MYTNDGHVQVLLFIWLAHSPFRHQRTYKTLPYPTEGKCDHPRIKLWKYLIIIEIVSVYVCCCMYV